MERVCPAKAPLLAAVVLTTLAVIVSSSPVIPHSTGVSAEDMNTGIDSPAMQGLLKKLWKFEAENWKRKFVESEKRSGLLEEKVEELVDELQDCRSSQDQTPQQIEGQWSDVVTDDDGDVDDDQAAENDLRALADKPESVAEGQRAQDSGLYDTEFVIIPVMEDRSLPEADAENYIQITSPQNDDVSVHVIEPRDAQEVTYRIPAHGVIQIPMSRLPKGETSHVQLQSDKPVKVQVLTRGNSPADGYNVIFMSDLGTDYSLSGDDTRFAIVSLVNATGVKVQDSEGKALYAAVLEQGQTFLTPSGRGVSLAGGRILAEHPVAVFSVRPTPDGRTQQVLQQQKERKAWNDCLMSSSGCKKTRPRPG